MAVSALEVLIGIAFLLPGFIFVKVREHLIPSPRRDFSTSANELIGYSAINYVLFSPFIFARLQDWRKLEFEFYDYLVLFIATLIFPMMAAIVGFRLNRKNYLERLAGLDGALRSFEPTAWDWFFGNLQRPCWVMVRLRNGESVAGIYGKGSFASKYPEPPSLFLATTYRLKDGEFDSKVDDGAGVLINGEDIHLLEFWNIQEE